MPAILGAASQKGCPHEPHEVYCIEHSCTLCTECSRDLLRSQQNQCLTMTPLRELSRLVTEDLNRLRLTHLCMEKAHQTLRLEGHSALDSEARRCKEEIDRFLLRVVQGVQVARERLYHDVDSYVSERRRLLEEFAVTKRHVDSLIFDAETILNGSTSQSSEPLDCIQRQISTAHLLSAAEERVVLDAESSLERLFPFLKEVSGNVDFAGGRTDRRQVAPRDIVSLPNGHELHLVPFTLRLSTAATALLSELEQLKIKNNGNAGPNLQRDVDSTGGGTGSARTPTASQKLSSRKDKWKPCQGIGSEGARRRNIRTPDILA